MAVRMGLPRRPEDAATEVVNFEGGSYRLRSACMPQACTQEARRGQNPGAFTRASARGF